VEQWEEQLSHTCLCTKIQSTSSLTYILSCTGILHTSWSYLIYDRLLPSWEIGFNRFDRRQEETLTSYVGNVYNDNSGSFISKRKDSALVTRKYSRVGYAVEMTDKIRNFVGRVFNYHIHNFFTGVETAHRHFEVQIQHSLNHGFVKR